MSLNVTEDQPTTNDKNMGKIAKVRDYLRRGDARGLTREIREYIGWLSDSVSGQDIIDAWWELRVKYGLTRASQHGEDAVLRRLLAKHPRPYLVDVGAHDGRSWSNSRPFMLWGWHGILIEPLPKVYAQLSKLYATNDRAVCLNLACTDRAGEQPLFLGTDGDIGMGSTLCTDENAWFDRARTSETIVVETDTLTRVLERAQWPVDFGLLLIDAEGMDYEVLQGLDLTRYRPAVIVSEEYVANQKKHDAKYALLRAAGYQLHSVIDGANSIWLESTFAVKAQI